MGMLQPMSISCSIMSVCVKRMNGYCVLNKGIDLRSPPSSRRRMRKIYAFACAQRENSCPER